jgi:2,3,4,5-tetrahydropyridine-2-carboxylate N-succinyltransferase
MTKELETIIEQAWDKRAELAPGTAPAKVGAAIKEVIAGLDAGTLRVAEKLNGAWVVHQWVKKAVLLSFRVEDNQPLAGAATQYFDKVPGKFTNYSREDFARGGFRVVPPAMVRRGAFIGRNAILMPSYVYIGAYVDEGTMVDTWATVGSCAQIGRNVHLSGGVGIGGVLEPPQAAPVVVEDDAFIGSRSMVVEGARVRAGAKLGAGTILTASTHVVDAATGEEYPRGEAPAGAICVGSTRVKSFPGGDFGMPIVLVLRVLAPDEQHDKLALNDVLREHGVAP